MMKISLRLTSILISTALLAGCSSFAGQRDRDIADQQRMQQSQQSQMQQGEEQRTTTRQPLKRGSITGEVTAAGGLITEDGIPYRLNGAKAAPLRDYTGETVTVDGLLTSFEGERAIIVENFQAMESSRTARSEQERMNAGSTQPARQQRQTSRDADLADMPDQPERQAQPQRNEDLPGDRQQQMSRDADAPSMNGEMQKDSETNQ